MAVKLMGDFLVAPSQKCIFIICLKFAKFHASVMKFTIVVGIGTNLTRNIMLQKGKKLWNNTCRSMIQGRILNLRIRRGEANALGSIEAEPRMRMIENLQVLILPNCILTVTHRHNRHFKSLYDLYMNYKGKYRALKNFLK